MRWHCLQQIAYTPFQPRRWTALYDDAGNYITDVKLLRTVDEKHSPDLKQFSLIFRTRSGVKLDPGMYVVDDFETQNPGPFTWSHQIMVRESIGIVRHFHY